MSHLLRPGLLALLLLAPLVPPTTGCGGRGGLPARDDLVAVETTALPQALTGAAYTAVVQARGPHLPLAWRIVDGRLPRGLSLDGDDGTISGYPREVGPHRVEVQVRDGADASLARDASFAAARAALVIDVGRGPLALLPFPIPYATFGSSFVHRLEAAGGTEPYAFSLAEGRWPAGLSLETDGTILGVPREAGGPVRARVRVTDALGEIVEADVEMRVAVRPLAIVTAGLPAAALGFPYAASLEVLPGGGGPPYAWRVVGDGLPPGLRIDASLGHIDGKAVSTGTFALEVEVEDAAGQVVRKGFSIRVNPGPVLDSLTPPTWPPDGSPITIRGQAFQSGMKATFGVALPLEVEVIDATYATVVAPSSPVQSGPVDVTIVNPDGGRDVRAKGFRYPLATVTFEPAGVHGQALGSSRGLAAGDVDGDGKADIVRVGSDGIELLRGGTWVADSVRSSGSYNDVRLADLDADGDLDLVTIRSSSTETIEAYLNDGHGHFPATASKVTSYPKPSGGHYPNSIATGDVDGDGIPDLAFTSGRGGQGVLWIVRGMGDGSFVPFHTASDSIWSADGGCFGPNAVSLCDLDGDGCDDVIATDAFPNACATGQACPSTDGPDLHPGRDDFVAWVALSRRAGAPATDPALRPWSVLRVTGIYGHLNGDNLGLAVYDHDGDGLLDLAVMGGYLDQRGMGVAFLRGDGAGGFTERFVRPTAFNRRYGAPLDANLDACVDLLVVGGDGRAGTSGAHGYSLAECYLGGPEEVPERAWTSGNEFSASIPDSNPGRVVVGDFDGDGLQDFAVDQSFQCKERYGNDQADGLVEGVAIYLNRSH